MGISEEYIITLQSIHGFGPATVGKVCDKINNGTDASGLDLESLYDIVEEMAKTKRIRVKEMPDFDMFERANDIAKRILSKNSELGIRTVSRYDDSFPRKLLDTVSEDGKKAAPILLYYKGDPTVTERPALAVIGTREPTEEGIRAGHYYAEAFASIGVNIVSGLALGCDTAGHLGALDAGGVTTAFLAHGLDTVYPAENTELAERIVASGGLLMSEYPVGDRVNRYNLVARDRLQAGLSDATLVVQTGVRGGTMHAVRATRAAGKPLFVVDYSKSLGEKTEGNEYLKTNGAQGLRVTKEEIEKSKDIYIAKIQGRNKENKEKKESQGELF